MMMGDMLRRVRRQTAHEMGPTGTFFFISTVNYDIFLYSFFLIFNKYPRQEVPPRRQLNVVFSMIPIFKELVIQQTNNIQNLFDF